MNREHHANAAQTRGDGRAPKRGGGEGRSISAPRIWLIAVLFALCFATIGWRLGVTAMSGAVHEIAALPEQKTPLSGHRADIVDRRGRLVAMNTWGYGAYANPKNIQHKQKALTALTRIFPETPAEFWAKKLNAPGAFVWLRARITPEQAQAIHDIGDPGLLYSRRQVRTYPNGALAAHVIGGMGRGAQSVKDVELRPTGGIESALDGRLRNPEQLDTPVVLSLDLAVQAAVEELLGAGMKVFGASGAAAIVMEARSGEILALASLPDFDPNKPIGQRQVDNDGHGSDPRFNLAAQGVYELGSTFKIFTTANALELGVVEPDTLVDADAPMEFGRFTIGEYNNKNYGPELSVTDVIVKSSNVGTARLALEIGKERQQEFLRALGVLDPSGVELAEAQNNAPLLPKVWSDTSAITISYGHGISVSPLHLAAAYASLANGGFKVTPTLLHQKERQRGVRVMRGDVSRASVDMLRQVVLRGTARKAEVPGYEVAGKTGTADIAKKGAYDKLRSVNTFAAVFPASAPKYVVVVTLFNPKNTFEAGQDDGITAGASVTRVTGSIIGRIAPLLGLRPAVPPGSAEQKLSTEAQILGEARQG